MKIKEIIFDFCQEFNLPGTPINLNWDAKPTLKLFLYNAYRKFRGWQPIYCLRMAFQKVFRLNHFSDCELWEAGATMARRILPVLYAFKKHDRHGYPGKYSVYDEHCGLTKENYDKALIEGKVIGGGAEAWEKDIDHMIASMEYLAFEYSHKKQKKWFLKYFGMDPYAEDERNKYIYKTYRTKDGLHSMSFHEGAPIEEGATEIEEQISYGNSELINYIDEWVACGLRKYGESFQSFWD